MAFIGWALSMSNTRPPVPPTSIIDLLHALHISPPFLLPSSLNT
jgi:hypothetical protein